jgi:hypothetical protein
MCELAGLRQRGDRQTRAASPGGLVTLKRCRPEFDEILQGKASHFPGKRLGGVRAEDRFIEAPDPAGVGCVGSW